LKKLRHFPINERLTIPSGPHKMQIQSVFHGDKVEGRTWLRSTESLPASIDLSL
jgi:hypothetical protein